MRNPIILCGECRKPRDFSSQGFCESKNREVDPDITNAMIGFSHHIRLDQKRMLSIFFCHKDSRVMAFLHGLIILKPSVSNFLRKSRLPQKKEEADYRFFFLFMKILFYTICSDFKYIWLVYFSIILSALNQDHSSMEQPKNTE